MRTAATLAEPCEVLWTQGIYVHEQGFGCLDCEQGVQKHCKHVKAGFGLV